MMRRSARTHRISSENKNGGANISMNPEHRGILSAWSAKQKAVDTHWFRKAVWPSQKHKRRKEKSKKNTKAS